MASPFSKVVFNSFEQLLSSDVNRLQNMSSREVQNLFKELLAGGGGPPVPISGYTSPPTLTFLSAFTMTLGAGSAFFQETSGVSSDDSTYQVLRWPSQTVSFSAADPTNPRIDLIVATPAQVESSPIFRNILVNPITRLVAATSVFKNQDPVSAISIVAGAPSAIPVPPAVPAGKLALFEVFVPSAAPSAATFAGTYRVFRLAPTPISVTHAVLRGCALVWNDNAGDVRPVMRSHADNVAIIDGEVIQFASDDGSLTFNTLPELVGDGNTANNPFVTANTAATNARPYYLYLCGGRNMPQQSGQAAIGSARVPVVIVASLVAPDQFGFPTTSITTPRGALSTTQLRKSALYVGMGFSPPLSALSMAMRMEGDWVYVLADTNLDNNPIATMPATTGFSVDFPINSKPPFVHQCMLTWDATWTALGSTNNQQAFLNTLFGATAGCRSLSVSGVVMASPLPSTVMTASGIVPLSQQTSSLRISRAAPALAALDNVVRVMGYPHHAPRLDANAGLFGDNT